jgi:hypothetical protein
MNIPRLASDVVNVNGIRLHYLDWDEVLDNDLGQSANIY